MGPNELHETTTISSLLTNAEAWVLTKTQRESMDRIELWALKKLYNVPPTTPTLAVMIVSGTLFASQRIDQRQMIYLKSILNRPDDKWLKLTLQSQKEQNCYWAKQIGDLLSEYGIEMTWDDIKQAPFALWKRTVKNAIEKKHKTRLMDLLDCSKKAAFAKNFLESESYERKPLSHVLGRNKMGARALIMGMAGMLDCANNFHSKYKTKECKECHKIDDESHRINDCIIYERVNLYHSRLKIDFDCIYSNKNTTLDRMETVIRAIWALDNGKNYTRIDVE